MTSSTRYPSCSGYLDKAKTVAQDPILLDYLDRMETSTKAIGKLVKFTRDYKDLGINPPRWFTIKDCVNCRSRNGLIRILSGLPLMLGSGRSMQIRRLPGYSGTFLRMPGSMEST